MVILDSDVADALARLTKHKVPHDPKVLEKLIDQLNALLRTLPPPDNRDQPVWP